MNKRCYIAGAGEFCSEVLPEQGDYVIAADGGFESLTSHGITPNLVVGDFDSLGSVPEHPNVILSPVQKDDTDMMLAVRYGLEHGYKTFVINGGLGGRLDQTLANIQILAYIAENDARGTLYGQGVCVTAIKNGKIEFGPDMIKGATISMFSAGGRAMGVTLTGLKYPLDNATLTSDYPIGVSNEFTGAPAVVSVRSGTLVIIWERQKLE